MSWLTELLTLEHVQMLAEHLPGRNMQEILVINPYHLFTRLSRGWFLMSKHYSVCSLALSFSQQLLQLHQASIVISMKVHCFITNAGDWEIIKWYDKQPHSPHSLSITPFCLSLFAAYRRIYPPDDKLLLEKYEGLLSVAFQTFLAGRAASLQKEMNNPLKRMKACTWVSAGADFSLFPLTLLSVSFSLLLTFFVFRNFPSAIK